MRETFFRKRSRPERHGTVQDQGDDAEDWLGDDDAASDHAGLIRFIGN